MMRESVLDRATMRDAMQIAGIAEPERGQTIRCPFHDDDKPSLHLVGDAGRETGFKCFGCDAHGGVLDFIVQTNVAADRAEAARLLEERLGGVMIPEQAARVVASYVYEDGAGNAIARIDRLEPGRNGRSKDFLPFLALSGGGFAEKPGLNGAKLPLYRRGDVLRVAAAGGTVFLVEGEGKADRLRELLASDKVAVTTVQGGANAPLRADQVADFKGVHHAVVIADSDAPGRAAAKKRADAILEAYPGIDVRIVDLFPSEHNGSDVADWIAQGHTIADLRQIINGTSRHKGGVITPNDGVLSFDQLAARATQHEDWCIEGLLRDSGLLLMVSQPKVGKSELARNLAKAVATGGTFLGRRCKQGRVLWVGLEEPTSHLLDRIEVHGLRDLPISWVVDQPTGDESAWLRMIVEKHQPDFVIIDTVGRFARIENINDYSMVTRATQPMLDIRARHGTSFTLLHHSNRNDGVLGSTMWEGVVDTILSVTRNPEGQRFVKTTQRSGTAMEPTALAHDQDTGAITCAESKYIADQRAAEQRILSYLRLLGRQATREELARHSGGRAHVGRSAVDAMVSAGLLLSTGEGRNGSPRLYRLPDDGRGSSFQPSPQERGVLIDELPDVPDPRRSDPGRSLPDVSPTLDELPDVPELPDTSDWELV